MDRGVQVSVLDFEISATEAVRRFEDYQRKACMYLHAQSLLKNATATGASAYAAVGTRQPVAEPAGAEQAAGSSTLHTPGSVTSSLTATYLPYWCFETTFNSVAHAKLGFKEERSVSGRGSQESGAMQGGRPQGEGRLSSTEHLARH